MKPPLDGNKVAVTFALDCFPRKKGEFFMGSNLASLVIAAIVFVLPVDSMAASAEFLNVQVGPRPYYLVEAMDEGPLKTALKQCSEKPLRKTDFSIGHRGAALRFPEHTKESYEAAARMGAGILECDV